MGGEVGKEFRGRDDWWWMMVNQVGGRGGAMVVYTRWIDRYMI